MKGVSGIQPTGLIHVGNYLGAELPPTEAVVDLPAGRKISSVVKAGLGRVVGGL
ncbi:MAG: hypothetical protein RDU89_11995 [bacterium]|nr:hypothetical protein [bacterium]